MEGLFVKQKSTTTARGGGMAASLEGIIDGC